MASDPKQVQDIFLRLVEHAPGDLAAAMERECGLDAELRARVRALLRAYDEPDSYLEKPDEYAPGGKGAATGAHTPDPGAPRGQDATMKSTSDYRRDGEVGAVFAGRYTLQEKIGEGGMGEVWVAQQLEPVKRKVALKLIKMGMDTKAVLQRFEQERQALGMMDHPNIARVLDGGVTTRGQPFFVMELVNGLPLNRFCDETKLTPKARLELFVPICQAVQHAHQKGIVHRDLKPANILVTLIDGQPVPKVIDFGVAKATGGKLTDESMATHFGTVVGTLEYMSPEQAGFSHGDVDTRADIYSLGVILYELLTGLRPIDAKRLNQAALTEMIRIIQNEEPSRPSTRLSTDAGLPSLAAMRQIEPKRLMSMLRGELDWVVMKCLEKQRERRYETANGLARDIQRFLANEAVEARPASAGYRLSKFLRRNKGPVIAASAIIVALVAGFVGITIGLARAENARLFAERQEDEARRSDAKAQAVKNFLIHDLLESAAPEKNPVGSKISLREVLDQAAKHANTGFQAEPEVDAEVQLTIGSTYLSLGLFDQAESHLQRAVDLRLKILGAEHIDTLTAQDKLATLRQKQGKIEDAKRLFEETLKTRQRVLGSDAKDTCDSLNNLATLLVEIGDFESAEVLFRQALPILIRVNGLENEETLTLMTNLSWVLQSRGQLSNAQEMLEKTVEPLRSVAGKQHPLTLNALNILATVLQKQQKLAQAEVLFREILDARRVVQGADHSDTVIALNNLAVLLREEEQLTEAEQLLREVVEAQRRVQGAEHPLTFYFMNSLAMTMLAQGHHTEAEPLFREVLAERRKILPADHAHIADTLTGLGECLIPKPSLKESENVLREALAAYHKSLPPEHVRIAQAESVLGECLTALGRVEEAEPLLIRSCQRLSGGNGIPAFQIRNSHWRLINHYLARDKTEPGKGHDASSAKWKVEAARYPAPPATAPADK